MKTKWLPSHDTELDKKASEYIRGITAKGELDEDEFIEFFVDWPEKLETGIFFRMTELIKKDRRAIALLDFLYHDVGFAADPKEVITKNGKTAEGIFMMDLHTLCKYPEAQEFALEVMTDGFVPWYGTYPDVIDAGYTEFFERMCTTVKSDEGLVQGFLGLVRRGYNKELYSQAAAKLLEISSLDVSKLTKATVEIFNYLCINGNVDTLDMLVQERGMPLERFFLQVPVRVSTEAMVEYLVNAGWKIPETYVQKRYKDRDHPMDFGERDALHYMRYLYKKDHPEWKLPSSRDLVVGEGGMDYEFEKYEK